MIIQQHSLFFILVYTTFNMETRSGARRARGRPRGRGNGGRAATIATAQQRAVNEEPQPAPPTPRTGRQPSTKGQKPLTVNELALTVDRISQSVEVLQNNAQASDGKVDRLDRRMTTVTTDMSEMKTNIQFIVSAISRDGPPTTAGPLPRQDEVQLVHEVIDISTPAFPESRSNRHEVRQLPPPAALVASENRNGEVDRAMQQHEFRPNRAYGKRLECGEYGMPRPYMFTERDGLQTTKQKLDLRNSLTFISRPHWLCYMTLTLLIVVIRTTFCPTCLMLPLTI